MRVFLTILFFVGSFLAIGQMSKEEFLNNIRPILIDTTISRFNLSSQTETLYHDRQLDPDIKQELLRFLPKAATIDIITGMNTDTSTSLWNRKLLLNATLVNANKADTLIGNIVVNHTGLNKKQHNKLKNDLKAKRGRVYYFSRPIFDRTKKFALIQMRYACGTGCGNGCLYIFKADNDRWIKLCQINCWIA